MNNKLLIILIVLSLSLTAFLAGYLISQSDFTKQSANLGQGSLLEKFGGEGGTAGQTSLEPVMLSSKMALSPTVSKDKNSVIFYDRTDGKVFEVSPTNLKEKVISETPLQDLTKTIWSPNKNEVVSVFYDVSGERYKYYSYQTRRSIDFGILTKSLTFSPDGSRIAYFRSQGLEGGIYIASPDGSTSKLLLNTRLSDLTLQWPSREYLSFKTNRDGIETVFLLSVSGGLTKFVEETEELDILWSSDGKKLLYSLKNNGATMLYIKELHSPKAQPLNIATTASKCAWSVDSENLICSLPKSSSGGEELYEINLNNGDRTLIVSPSNHFVASNLMLLQAEEYIVFVNNVDGRLYSFKR